MSAKRVLIAHVPYEHRGGEDVHVETLARAYSRIGWDPVFYPSTREPQRHSLISGLASLAPGRVPADFLELWQDTRPAFIHLHNSFPTLGPGFFGWVESERVPLVMTVHNHRFYCTNGLALRNGKVCKDCLDARIGWRPLLRNCNQSWIKSGYHAASMTEMRSLRLYERAVRKFIAPSPYIEAELLRFGIDRDQVIWLPNPVESPLSTGETHQSRFDVLYAGRLSEEKGVRSLLTIFSSQLADLKLGIAGDGPERGAVIETVQAHSNVTYLGPLTREDLWRTIEESRIGILPSLCNEILPTFALECFFRGKRCVMTDQESMRWLARDDFPGILGPAADIEGCASAVRGALTMPAPTPDETAKVQSFFGFDSFCTALARVAEGVGS